MIKSETRAGYIDSFCGNKNSTFYGEYVELLKRYTVPIGKDHPTPGAVEYK